MEIIYFLKILDKQENKKVRGHKLQASYILFEINIIYVRHDIRLQT